MSDRILYTHVGSTAHPWLVTFIDSDGKPVVLTDATAIKAKMTDRETKVPKFDWTAGFIAEGAITLPNGDVLTLTKADGVAGYQPATGDVDTDGTFDLQFEATINGKPYFSPLTEVRIAPSL